MGGTSVPEGFSLIALPDGRKQLRVASGDGSDPIVLDLDERDGRALGVAMADVLTALDVPDGPLAVCDLILDGRRVTVSGTPERGLRVEVERPTG